MQKIQQKITEIENELKSSPGDPELLNELGVGYHILGEHKEAINHFKQAISQSEREAKFHFNLANSYYESENVKLAINSYMDAIDIKPDYVPALNNLADIYELAGKKEKAKELFRYIVKIQPEDAVGYLNLGNYYLRNNNTLEAGKSYQKAIKQDDACYEAYNNIGFILKHLGKHKEALGYFEECLQIKPDYKPAKEDLESCKKQLNREE